MNPADAKVEEEAPAAASAAGAPVASAGSIAPAQESDVWWGSWSGWTMLPSLVVSVVLTGVIVWWAWTYVDRRFVQLTIWALAGLVWLVQLWRWSWRWFGCNYRLTSRRLIVWRGHFLRLHLMTPLTRLEHVRVEHYSHSRWTGVGRIVIALADGNGEIDLDGIKQPHEVAELIRATALRARVGRPAP